MRSSSSAPRLEVLRFVDDEQHQAAREPLVDQILRQVAQEQRLALA